LGGLACVQVKLEAGVKQEPMPAAAAAAEAAVAEGLGKASPMVRVRS
jgi:hypothetical protein